MTEISWRGDFHDSISVKNYYYYPLESVVARTILIDLSIVRFLQEIA